MHLHNGIAALNRIDLTDLTFRISTKSPLHPLIDSIRRIGLIHPPILLEKSNGWIVVSGFRRVTSCLHLGWSETPARIIPPDYPADRCAKIAIADNALQRSLNIMEQSRSLALIRHWTGERLPADEELVSLGLPANPQYLEKLQRVGELPEPVQEGIIAEHISLTAAMTLGKMSRKTAVEFADMFSRLQLSMNKQKEVITLIREIAARDEVAETDILTDGRLKEILHDDNQDRALKSRRLRAALQQWRFPAMTEAKRFVEDQIRQLKLGPGVSMKPPPNFEGNSYTLEFSFKNRSELIQRKAVLDRAVENPLLDKILDS